MNCPDCGNPIEKDATFCPKCYARIEPPSLLRRLTVLFQNLSKPRPSILSSQHTDKFITVDNDGNRHEYRSVAEMPLELRSQIEKFQEASKEQGSAVSGDMSTSDIDEAKRILQKNFPVYKFRDASGQEHVFHSLDELPPNVQEALKRLQDLPRAMVWRGKSVAVRATLVPRYLWTSASIDVYLDGERVFRTGGKMNLTGSHCAGVRIGGSEHQMEVSWGRSRNFVFPYELRIDGELVAKSQVHVENQGLMLIPAWLILILIAVGVNQLLKIFWPHLNGG